MAQNDEAASLTTRDIEVANRLMLGRSPTKAEIETKLKNHRSLDQLRATYWSSPEFATRASHCLRISHAGATPQKSEGGDTLIHVHIQKTAGSSLSAILNREYKPGEVLSFSDNSIHRVTRMSSEQLAKVKLVHGHLSYGIADLFPQKCHYVTVLRQPKDRLLSLYRYTARTEDHPLYGVVTKNNMGFGEYLEFLFQHPELARDMDNAQIRRLASDKISATDNDSKALLFQQALSNIAAPDMTFGLTEYFEYFLDRLFRRRIITNPEEVRSNTAPSPTNIKEVMDGLTERQREILESFTEWDQKFYDICKQVYCASEAAAA